MYEIYSRLRTRGAEICGSQTAPYWGVWLGDGSSFSGENAERGKRLLKLGSEVTVLAVAANGQAAGLRASDVINKIDDTVLKQHAHPTENPVDDCRRSIKKGRRATG